MLRPGNYLATFLRNLHRTPPEPRCQQGKSRFDRSNHAAAEL